MEEEYWNKFMDSGQVTDYLFYKGMGICESVMKKFAGGSCTEPETGDRLVESDNSDRDGAYSCTYRGI